MVPAYLGKYVESLSTFTTRHKLQRRKTEKKKKNQGDSTWRQAHKTLYKERSCTLRLFGTCVD